MDDICTYCEKKIKAYQKEYNIVSGLIKAISILDEVIKTIRASKNKVDAKNNLVEKYDFTEEQAEAIVMLQLYKLTNTDVVLYEEMLPEETVEKAIKAIIKYSLSLIIKFVLANLSLLHFHTICKSFCSNSVKNAIDRNCIESVDFFG